MLPLTILIVINFSNFLLDLFAVLYLFLCWEVESDHVRLNYEWFEREWIWFFLLWQVRKRGIRKAFNFLYLSLFSCLVQWFSRGKRQNVNYFLWGRPELFLWIEEQNSSTVPTFRRFYIFQAAQTFLKLFCFKDFLA